MTTLRDGGSAGGSLPRGLDHTEAVAVDMICRLVSGKADEAELIAAKAWRDMNADHADAFERMSHAWTLIKPAGAKWKRRQRMRRLVSAVAYARASLLSCGRLFAKAAALPFQGPDEAMSRVDRRPGDCGMPR